MSPPAPDLPRVPLHRDPRLRGIALQVALCAVVGLLAYGAISNAVAHLATAKVTSGFAFWNFTAGFDISQTLIDYSAQSSTYGRAFFVGLLNTLLVASLGIVLATLLGFAIGIARRSSNFLVARLAAAYVELVRNVPLLLQLLFWYHAVLKALPEIAASWVLPAGITLNNRGLFLPRPLFAGGWDILAAFGAAVALAIVFVVATGRSARWGDAIALRGVGALVIVLGVPALAFAWSGAPLAFEYPAVGRFNVRGGLEILPEFAALLLGLVIYTAAFIAEVVRAGLAAVPRGQAEAAAALGLHPLQALRLVVIPQAMRVIIPPLTNQYLNLTKNSSLAVAIGYPDLMEIFSGTVLNQTNQAVETVAITMAVYLGLSLAIALVMNLFNARFAVVER